MSSFVFFVPATICGICLKGLVLLDHSKQNVNDKINAFQEEAAQRETAQRETAQREAAQREAAQRKAAQRKAAQINSRANVTKLSGDPLCHVMGFLNTKDIANCMVLNKDFYRELKGVPNDLRVLNAQCEAMAIAAKKKWETNFGEIGEVPSFPNDIHTILGSPCPFDSSKKVVETHMLMLIPATVNRQPLTLNSLRALVKQPKQGNATACEHVSNQVLVERGDAPIVASHWVLMTKDVILGSRNRSYAGQQNLVRKDLGYDVPNLLEAVVCILMEYVSTGVRRYSRDDLLTYTRCQEQVSGYQIIVGSFVPSGLFIIHNSDSVNLYVGVAALRKFVS